MKRRTVVCAALLLAWTMMSDAALSVNATYSGTITSDTIKEMEQQISDAKKEKNSLQDKQIEGSNAQQSRKQPEAWISVYIKEYLKADSQGRSIW